MRIDITDHAFERGRERMGLSKPAFIRVAYLAFRNGITHESAKGMLKTYIEKEYHAFRQSANNIRIRADYVFCFRDSALITVYALPKKLQPLARKLKAKKQIKKP